MTTTSFDPDTAWRRTPTVVLRPEPFGALVYDFGSRRLSFLRDQGLVRVVARRPRTPCERAARPPVRSTGKRTLLEGLPAKDAQ